MIFASCAAVVLYAGCLANASDIGIRELRKVS
eukprot:COSAG05_NODE_20445_length_279_cov_0.838889_1_plen_31_part_10